MIKSSISFFFFVMVVFCCSCGNESIENKKFPEKGELSVTWENVSNFISERPGFRVKFTIENNSDDILGNSGWALYFNQSPRNLIPGSVSETVKIEHINGDFYRLSPAPSFNLEPGKTISISADFEDWMIKEVDAPLGLYFVFSDEEGNELSRVPVEDYTIKPFEKPEQMNRFRNDETPIPTPEWQFGENENLTILENQHLNKIIPKPVFLQDGNGSVKLNSGLMIHYHSQLKTEAEILASLLSQVTGIQPLIMESSTTAPNIITLKTGNILVNGVNKEAYHLVIEQEGISISGSDPSGVFYGIQSLLALLPVETFENPTDTLELKAVVIKDAPAFGYRGLHLDLARNFQKKSTVLKLIDILSFYKLNKLHMHITDDEGWRIEIEELPELTEVGGFRGHTLDEKEYLAPAYGSGPFPDPETSHGNGFFTREEFKEIIRYAHERHIEVIPEINMPGHARAAIYAMQARYRKLMSEGKQNEAEAYLLTDFSDTSVYFSAQAYDDNVICVCKESVYHFYETVVDDLIEMYEEADVPLLTIHTGGDEVPGGVWEGSPICQEFLKENPQINGAKDLQPYFVRRLVEILNKKNLTIAGWEEVAMKFLDDGSWITNTEFTDKNVLPYVWNSLWGNQDLGYRLANGGYPVILCNVNFYYFDMAWNKDPKEPGLYWGGFVNTRNGFEFIPYDLFKSMTVNPMGIPFDEEGDFKTMERLSPDSKKNILGIQGELWSETVKGQDMLEYYYLPKLLGLAERAWQGQADWGSITDKKRRAAAINKDWNVFANTIGQNEFPRLDYIFGGYNYRIPVPGARIIDGRLHANLSYPGMTIRYTTDGTEPDENANSYTEPEEVTGTVKLRAFDTRGRGGRIVTLLAQ